MLDFTSPAVVPGYIIFSFLYFVLSSLGYAPCRLYIRLTPFNFKLNYPKKKKKSLAGPLLLLLYVQRSIHFGGKWVISCPTCYIRFKSVGWAHSIRLKDHWVPIFDPLHVKWRRVEICHSCTTCKWGWLGSQYTHKLRSLVKWWGPLRLKISNSNL